MATDTETLVSTLKADITGYEREMKRAGQVADESARRIERRMDEAAKTIEARMRSMGVAAQGLKGLITGFLTSIGVTQLLAVIKSVADLERQAKAAAVSLQELQEIQFAAQNLSGGKLTPDKTAEGLAALAKKAYDEVYSEEGDLQKLFELNNMTLKTREGNLRAINDILEDASRLVQNARSEFDKVKIAELLGLSQEWVSVLEKGPEAIRTIAAQAQAAGAVLDAETVKKAQQFEQEWAAAVARWSVAMRSGIKEVMDFLERLASLATRVLNFIDNFVQKDYLGRTIKGGGIGTLSDSELQRAIKLGVADPTILQSEVRRRGFTSTDPFDNPALNALGGPARAAIVRRATGTKLPSDEEESDSGGKSARAARAKQNEFEREERNMQRRIRSLGAEAEAIGKTTFEAAKAEATFRLLTAAEQAGVPVTDAVRQKVDELATSYAQAKTRLAELELAQRNWVGLQEFGGSQMISIIKGATQGMNGLVAATKRLADALFDAALQALILGKGPFASLFGMATTSNGGVGGLTGLLFGGLRSAGGSLFGGSSGGYISEAAGQAISDAAGWGVGAFAGGGWSDRPTQFARVPAAAFRNAPAFAMGGAIPALLHPGEVILNAAQQRNVADRMGGPSVRIENYGQVGLVDVTRTADRDFVVTVAKQEAQRAVGVNNRHIRSVMSERQMREFR